MTRGSELQRPYHFGVRLTEDERRQTQLAAAVHGLPTSEWARRVLNREAAKVLRAVEYVRPEVDTDEAAT